MQRINEHRRHYGALAATWPRNEQFTFGLPGQWKPAVADPTPAILPWIAHMEIMHKLDSPFLTRRLLAWQFPPAYPETQRHRHSLGREDAGWKTQSGEPTSPGVTLRGAQQLGSSSNLQDAMHQSSRQSTFNRPSAQKLFAASNGPRTTDPLPLPWVSEDDSSALNT
ncbi:predicted protein [Histoplasma capsulatum G186AR]|uniref:Uncharacterized protein n=1 Tax=Ajellomyces capsulatus (strain G186AR / H82 / ATCC MYA-2454 / RMSCC 2432) TaxID=447093 RepID=C0NXD7_AJECG|nr:uncharacterized protein HCBG_08129 [Histoplasma capsulatum G186AR]EEH04003.1 predicted protein [Histoplasma capsulatum G186AR]